MMRKTRLNLGIIGCGNVGHKRAAAILESGQDKIVGVYDIKKNKAEALAQICGVKIFSGWRELLRAQDINTVIVATTTDVNLKIVLEALKNKKHVLAEKPLGKNAREASMAASAAVRSGRILKIGFNHRHHPAIFKAHKLVRQGAIGKLMYIRSVYGHGGRPGYDMDWRMQKKYSVGGELFDQGVHIIDLANWFLGDITKVFGSIRNFYWHKSPLEDNAFCQLYTRKNQIVDLHVSITQWKNKFLFEIFGERGYIIVNGLGKSYGIETLTLGTNVGQGKVPKEQVWQYEGPDISWKAEWKEFRTAVENKRQPLANAIDNLVVNKILESLYLSAKKGKIMNIR